MSAEPSAITKRKYQADQATENEAKWPSNENAKQRSLVGFWSEDDWPNKTAKKSYDTKNERPTDN
jgi:hypothetical protein